ncbi:hypothetical protein [Mycobacteroides abscessus]|uniref:hypothetical protein n=1 Tax=Mycobacteroides abscessus TaxID=36809 RepID=UPI000C268A80|nr:hypothetical protein [Mycobacteroides abscessus]
MPVEGQPQLSRYWPENESEHEYSADAQKQLDLAASARDLLTRAEDLLERLKEHQGMPAAAGTLEHLELLCNELAAAANIHATAGHWKQTLGGELLIYKMTLLHAHQWWQTAFLTARTDTDRTQAIDTFTRSAESGRDRWLAVKSAAQHATTTTGDA